MLVRTRAELAKVVASDPLGSVAKDGSRYLVSFLREALPAAVARELEAADVEPEQIVATDARSTPGTRVGSSARRSAN